MKKLLVAITAVALGTFAWGDQTDFAPGQSFNDMTLGAFTPDKEPGFWSDTADKTTVSDAAYTYSPTERGGKPAEFEEEEAGNYLAVKTPLATPLYRSVVSGGTAQSMAGGFYFDSLVHFTACDPDTNPEVPKDAKLAVWLQDLTEAEKPQAVTNLMITAAQFTDGDYAFTEKTYNCGNISKFKIADGDEWCRLTIKAIAEIGDGSQCSGFVVFVNGIAAAHTDSIVVTGVDIGLNDQAAQWNAQKMLFPSRQAQNATIAQVGFAGQGGVDDISFTRTAPEFAADFDFIKLTFDTAKIAKLYVTDGTTTNEFTTSPAQYVIKSDAAKYYYYQAQDGYISVPATSKIEIGDSKTVDITDVAAALFAVGDKKFATWAEAVAEAKTSGAAIKLAGNLTAGIALDDTEAEIVLDLAGKKITAGESDTEAIFVNVGTLTITNTAETAGVVEATGDGQNAVANATGTILITAGVYDGYVSVDGEYTVATGGKFSTEYNIADNLTPPDGFQFVKDQAEEYWVLEAISYVAQIGNDKYESLKAAIEAAEAGDTITVLCDCTTTDTAVFFNTGTNAADQITFVNNHTVTLDTKGKYSIYIVNANVKMTGTGTFVKPSGSASAIVVGSYKNPGQDGRPAKLGWGVLDFEGNLTGGNEETKGSDAPSGMIKVEAGYCNFVGGSVVDWRNDSTNGKCVTASGIVYKEENIDHDITNDCVYAGYVTIQSGTFYANTPLKAEETGVLKIVGNGNTAKVRPLDDAKVLDYASFCEPGYTFLKQTEGQDAGWYKIGMNTFAITVTDGAETPATGTADPATFNVESSFPLAVTLTKPTAPEGKKFKSWSANFGEIDGDTLTIDTFPNAAVVVTVVWEDEGSDVPPVIDDPDVPAPTKIAYEEWAAAQKAAGKTFDPKANGNVDRFMLGLDVDATDEAVEAKLDSIITAEMVNEIVANGFDKVDFSALAKLYPYAKFEFVESTKLTSTDTAKFYQLKVSLKKAE